MDDLLATGFGAEQLQGLSHQQGEVRDRIERLQLTLPEAHEPYTDKYFLRTNEILKAEGLNPFVRAQIFVRQGPGTVHGVEEVLAAIEKYSDLTKNGGRVYGLPEGSTYDAKEPLLNIEGRVQDIIELETIILGVLSRATTAANEGVDHVDLDGVTELTAKVKALIGDRDLVYGGARHWGWEEDALIAKAAYEGGASAASTDIGAETFGSKGAGTIPHALEVIFASEYGMELAVVKATEAFNAHIDPSVPRIALIDFNNQEVTDAVASAEALGDSLYAVRIDTCGENVAEGGLASADELRARFGEMIPEQDLRFWAGTGVTVSGVYAVRQALNEAGFEHVKIVLSSGFGKPEKVEAFVRAEEILGERLFDAVLVGGLYKPCRMATMDLVAASDSLETLDDNLISKVGRGYRPNPRLQLLLGNELN